MTEQTSAKETFSTVKERQTAKVALAELALFVVGYSFWKWKKKI